MGGHGWGPQDAGVQACKVPSTVPRTVGKPDGMSSSEVKSSVSATQVANDIYSSCSLLRVSRNWRCHIYTALDPNHSGFTKHFLCAKPVRQILEP